MSEADLILKETINFAVEMDTVVKEATASHLSCHRRSQNISRENAVFMQYLKDLVSRVGIDANISNQLIATF